MDKKHTPAPWKVGGYDGVTIYAPDDSDGDPCIISTLNIRSKNIQYLHDVFSFPKYSSQQANAEFIVRACNNHHELLEALEECLEYLESCYDADYQGEETGYIPNDAMSLGGRVEELINKAKGE